MFECCFYPTFQNPTGTTLAMNRRKERLRIPIQWIPLWSEEIFVTLPLGHSLASAETISLDQIAEVSFIFLKKGYALRGTTDRLFQQKGISPKITFEGEEVATAAELVAAGLGVSLLPDAGLDKSKIVQIRLREPKCQRVIGLALIEGRYLSQLPHALSSL